MILGINGFKSSGKDTVGQYLVDNYGYERASFATKLKESAAALFGIQPSRWEEWKNEEDMLVTIHRGSDTPYKSITVRTFLQRYGTESHREVFGHNFWVDQALLDLDLSKNYVFTDVRFENELKAIIGLGGNTIRIHRPGLASDDLHASEVEPDPGLIDYVALNNSTLDFLYREIDFIMGVIKSETRTYA